MPLSLPHVHFRLQGRDVAMLAAGVAVALLGVLVVHWIDSLKTPIPYHDSGITARWIPTTVTHWSGPINQMAQKYNLDPDLIAIIMTLESGGSPLATSEAGAQGLMQITPPTAGDIATRYLKLPVKTYDLMDPTTNIEFGTAYLALLRDTYGDAKQGPDWSSTVELIAAAYNGGFGAANSVYRGTGLGDVQTVVYSRDAFNMWRERHAAASPTFDRWKVRGGQHLLDAAHAAQQ